MVVLVTSSPHASSSLDAITDILHQELSRNSRSVEIIQLRDLPHSALLAGNREHPHIRRTHQLLGQAQSVVVISPSHAVSGSALLRSWLALLPANAFAGKTVQVVGIGTVRSYAVGIGSTLIHHSADRLLPCCFLHTNWLDQDNVHLARSPIAEELLHTIDGLRPSAEANVPALTQ